MSSSAYTLEKIPNLYGHDYDYKGKIKSNNYGKEIEDIEEDLLYRRYVNMLEPQFVLEHKKTNVGIEQAIEEIEREWKRFNIKNKVRLIVKKSSELCSILSFLVIFIYYLAILGKINLNPIYVIPFMPISFGAWLTNYINYEIWKSKNGR